MINLKNKIRSVFDHVVNTHGEQEGIKYLDSVQSAIKHYKYTKSVTKLDRVIPGPYVVSGGKVSPR